LKQLLLVLVCTTFFLTISYSQKKPLTFDGGKAEISTSNQCLSTQSRSELKKKISDNIAQLNGSNVQLKKSNVIVSFDWPLRMINNQQFLNYYFISNYVDHDPNATGVQYGASNLDYNCGNRTYDTNSGYNHQGIDIALWPFKWYMYNNDVIEVVAAEAGTIIGKDDGNIDDNCSCIGNWNGIYIMHADGSQAWYGHMKTNMFTTKGVGDTVVKGEFLGVVASSGCSTDPHLHFEIYDASNNLIDPYAGPCNSMNSTSWWSNQQAYQNPTLNTLMTHNAPPSLGCTSAEEPNFANCFNPGQTIYTAFYYRDQGLNDVTDMRLVQPDNTVWANWSHTSPGSYTASWWYWTWVLPLAGPYGTWRLEADYNGTTSAYEFGYSNDTCACPISWSHSNGNNLTGIQNTNSDFESFGFIQSDQVIQGSPSVVYDSGTIICLEVGFEVRNGATFNALIDGCGNQ